MIEDIQLRALFKAESEEHLQHLDDALLGLEKMPSDQTLLDQAFREAHSLKGAARMLGLSSIERPARQLEDQLNAARRAVLPLTVDTLARMAVDLAEMRELALVAVAPDGAPPPLELAPAPAPAPAPTATPASFAIDSVRVDTQKLDLLMTHAGELMVTRMRVARRLAEIDALTDLADEWGRSGAATSRLPPTLLALLARLRAGSAEDSGRLDSIAGELDGAIRQIRLLPLSNVFRLFPRLVHDLAQQQGKLVELVIEGEQLDVDKRILEEIKDPLMHMLRNAVDHGIELPEAREQAGKARVGTVRISASQAGSTIAIVVSDDGRGIDDEAIKRAAIKLALVGQAQLAAMNTAQIRSLIFCPGLSSAPLVTDVSGRGVGMDVVRTNVERLKGTIALQSEAGSGTRIALALPVALATLRVLIVGVQGHCYGLPVQSVQGLQMVAGADIFTLEGRNAVLYQGQPVSVALLADLLELAPVSAAAPTTAQALPCVILAAQIEDEFDGASSVSAFGVCVDALLGEQEIVLKAHSALLGRVRNVAGAAILDSGDICMVLDVPDLLASLRDAAPRPGPVFAAPEPKKTILLVEDSIATRTQEARILMATGYEVATAVDGQDAWQQLATRSFDAVVSDIVMPNLDGIGLTEKIRSTARHAQLPVILVTMLDSSADRRRGLDAGANAYIVKAGFDQQALLDCLERLT